MTAVSNLLTPTRRVHEYKEESVEQLATIFVVDDDPGIGRAMNSVGELLDLPVTSYLSASAFLDSYERNHPGCLILDVRMPGMSGLELQKKLVDEGVGIPIIMITAHATVRIAVEAMSRGAVTFLEKPCRLDELTSHIRRAIEIDAQRRIQAEKKANADARLARLTKKEREVFELVSEGMTNKEIAESLELSIRAVEDRRSRLMKKLGVRSAVELVRLSTH